MSNAKNRIADRTLFVVGQGCISEYVVTLDRFGLFMIGNSDNIDFVIMCVRLDWTGAEAQKEHKTWKWPHG